MLAPFFKGGNTSSVRRLVRVKTGKIARMPVESSVLAPFFKGGNTSSESWLLRVSAGKLAARPLEWSVLAPFFKAGNNVYHEFPFPSHQNPYDYVQGCLDGSKTTHLVTMPSFHDATLSSFLPRRVH